MGTLLSNGNHYKTESSHTQHSSKLQSCPEANDIDHLKGTKNNNSMTGGKFKKKTPPQSPNPSNINGVLNRINLRPRSKSNECPYRL